MTSSCLDLLSDRFVIKVFPDDTPFTGDTYVVAIFERNHDGRENPIFHEKASKSTAEKILLNIKRIDIDMLRSKYGVSISKILTMISEEEFMM